MPERFTRVYEHIDKIYNDLSLHFNIKKVDFGKYTIDEQIELCSSAWAMIGSEGAAFANQIFMQNGSLIIYLDTKTPDFQIPISQYMEHTYYTILYNILPYHNIIDEIINICTNHKTLFLN